MNYDDKSLRGGGGCCKNKNKSSALNSVNAERESFLDPSNDVSGLYSSLLQDNQFSELGEFEGNNDREESCWKIEEDDSFTVLTGKYESMNRDCLEEEEDNEEDNFLDQYLLSMSPIIDKKINGNRGEKGNKETSRTVPRRQHDVSVKCSESTEEIIGTPSEVALKLNEAIQHYLPRRKMKIEREVSKEAAAALNEEFDREPEEESVENLCPEEEPEYVTERRGCPGTYDRLLRENVPCADALNLREIALGRRIKRPVSVLPVEDECGKNLSAQSNTRTNPSGEKESCCCSKNKKKYAKTNLPPPQKSCCTKQPRTNKNVSFSF